MSDYRQLKGVSLNPERHGAKNAYEHCEMVVQRMKQLAKQNHCSQEDTATLVNLAYVHDIGKIDGTAKPVKSVELLPKYGICDADFDSLVKYHDNNLPWYISSTRGEASRAVVVLTELALCAQGCPLLFFQFWTKLKVNLLVRFLTESQIDPKRNLRNSY